MILAAERPICFFDFILCGVVQNAKNLIWIHELFFLAFLFDFVSFGFAVTHPNTRIQNIPQNLRILDKRQTLECIGCLTYHKQEQVQDLIVEAGLCVKFLEWVVITGFHVFFNIFVGIKQINEFAR